eukprot:TRINITY_DN3316_c1_g1_i1.p1 TRINITY_DN3316_c1_g1~~TRINITY_DN3316_c1_g1_i1.p1  ORF type:complete len:191 (-),score=17.26 TRINITY_DN3316_c1_g1_i1:376-948(-)
MGELMMRALLALINHHDTQLQDNAILTLKSLAPYQPGLIDQFSEQLVTMLIRRCEDSTREVSMSADTALAQLTQVLPKQRYMDLLLSQLSMEDLEPQLQVHVVENLGRICLTLKKDELLLIIQQRLLPALLQTFKSVHVGVRKAVVYCLVEIWAVVGDDLFPFLSTLNPAQQNLVKVYINRRVECQQQLG